MIRTTFLTALLLCLLVFAGLGGLGTSTAAQPSEQNAARQPKSPVFTVPVFVTGKAGQAVTLKSAQMRTLGERQFLVGPATDSPYTKNDFGNGVVWIPLEDVVQVVQIDPAQLR